MSNTTASPDHLCVTNAELQAYRNSLTVGKVVKFPVPKANANAKAKFADDIKGVPELTGNVVRSCRIKDIYPFFARVIDSSTGISYTAEYIDLYVNNLSEALQVTRGRA